MAVLSAHLQVAFDRLGSPAVIDYFKREKFDVKDLKKLMLSINNVIDDAEDKETTDLAVKYWLDDLKDVVFDAEDVLDVIATQAHDNEISPTATPWNPFDTSLHQLLEDVFDRMRKLREEKDDLRLNSSTRSNSTSETLRLPTTSLVEQYDVYGRDDDKDKIKKLLLSNDGSKNGDVIAIVGMGGLGKTTLAQFVFNDYEIERVFQPNKVWISVGEDFDVKRITKTILEKLTSDQSSNDFDELQKKLKETLSGKMCLIVLDDVWNENYVHWDNLRRPFSYVAPGSKILVTTRSESVASAMRATSTYKLEPLSDDACWSLFARHAIAENIPSNATFEACWLLFEKHAFEKHAYSTFEALGKKVVKKCGGIPLTAKVLGGLLGTRLPYEEWDEILTSNIWDLSKDVLPVIRLSYHYLPSNLKRCFAFCSIVPKDFDFEKEKLVLLWMAENLVHDSRGKRRIDVAYEYLRDLELRSLIQPSTHEGEVHFRMHDLVNDLAKSVSGEFYKSFDLGNSFNGGEKTRYLSYVSTLNYLVINQIRFKRVSEAKHLRTFLPLSRHLHAMKQVWMPVPSLLHSKILPQLNVLRSLSLAGARIKALPDFIENLKLLRYLDLSHNSELNELPESLASLYNLEVLILKDCGYLTKLPSKMGQLIKLNHLDIRRIDLKEMPLQMGRLKNLDVLTDFVVGKGSGSTIGELKELKYLRGMLRICDLQNITHPGDALEANLKEKSRLEVLRLEWGLYSDNSEDARIILDNLRPHVNLKKLSIYKYSGTSLPDWSGHHSLNAPKLTSLGLGKCMSLKVFPENMCKLFPSLSKLVLIGCPNLEALPQSGLPANLRTLEIKRCNKLIANRSSWGLQKLLSLSTLNIGQYECEDLDSFPDEGLLPSSLSILLIESLPNLTNLNGKSFQLLTCLEKLHLQDCPKLQCLPELPTSLSTLKISGCRLLESRCRREQGEDWSKIAHIPNIRQPIKFSKVVREAIGWEMMSRDTGLTVTALQTKLRRLAKD